MRFWSWCTWVWRLTSNSAPHGRIHRLSSINYFSNFTSWQWAVSHSCPGERNVYWLIKWWSLSDPCSCFVCVHFSSAYQRIQYWRPASLQRGCDSVSPSATQQTIWQSFLEHKVEWLCFASAVMCSRLNVGLPFCGGLPDYSRARHHASLCNWYCLCKLGVRHVYLGIRGLWCMQSIAQMRHICKSVTAEWNGAYELINILLSTAGTSYMIHPLRLTIYGSGADIQFIRTNKHSIEPAPLWALSTR